MAAGDCLMVATWKEHAASGGVRGRDGGWLILSIVSDCILLSMVRYVCIGRMSILVGIQYDTMVLLWLLILLHNGGHVEAKCGRWWLPHLATWKKNAVHVQGPAPVVRQVWGCENHIWFILCSIQGWSHLIQNLSPIQEWIHLVQDSTRHHLNPTHH